MKSNLHNTRGFSLVEVVLALAITVFALITILALLSTGLGASKVSLQQTEAINLATSVVADLRQVPTVAAIATSTASGGSLTSVSPRYGVDVTKPSATFYLDPSGNSSTAITASSRYKVSITLNQPASGQRTATYGAIIIGWPAQASSPLNSVSALIALDRN